jgi:putative aldouronate transport system permease protein
MVSKNIKHEFPERRHSTRFTPGDFFIYLAAGLFALVCVLPVLNMVAISFSDSSSAAAGQVFFLPKGATLASYEKLFSEGSFGRAFMVSVLRVLLGTTLSMIVTILMAYPLSKEKKQFRYRNIFMWIAVFTMFFSGGLIPTYMVIKTLNLTNNFLVLILPFCLNVYNGVLLMNFFRGIPKEIDEAATVDGAGPWRIMARIYLPISLPALATITLFTVVGLWNDFFTGLIYMNRPEGWPLQTYIQNLIIQVDFSAITDPQELIERLKVSNITFNAAKIVVSMIPILCVYPFLQRFFVHGLVMGSVKE